MKLPVIVRRVLLVCTSQLLVTSYLMAQDGKLGIKSNVPRAEVYLENNLVGSTDNKGSLAIDQLPAGTFQIELRKEGYRTLRATVRIKNGERTAFNAKLISREPPLNKATGKPAEARNKSRAKSKLKPAAEKKATEQATNKITIVDPPAQLNRSPEPPKAPVLATPAQPAATRPRTLALGLALVGVPLLAGAYWAIKTARAGHVAQAQADERPDQAGMSPTSPEGCSEAATTPDGPIWADDTEPTEKSAAPAASTWKKGFIKALRRKEELWQAGLIPEPEQKSPGEDPHKPQIIIDLSKEHYRYDEENGGPA